MASGSRNVASVTPNRKKENASSISGSGATFVEGPPGAPM